MARLSLTLLGGFQARVDDGRALDLSINEEWLLSERLRLRELALGGLARLLADRRDRRALEPATQIPHLDGEARLGLEAFFSHQRPPWASAAPPASSTH
jgi:hypothetical protein